MSYYVYILLCNNGSFYTGYTKNVAQRIKLHSTGKGARYTKAHPPKEVVYLEQFPSRAEAMRRERIIKKLNHKQKAALCRHVQKL
ncbi:MAG: GIY-YIG nuclease family protein [Candidatus Bathyarchaeia archaeon]|jgi:putative endonuclease